MPKIKITKRAVDALPHTAKGQKLYSDITLPGFYLVVGKQSKTFVAQKDINGRTVRYTIGKFGHVAPEMARQIAQELLCEMQRGIDPNEKKRRQQEINLTLKVALEEYLEVRNNLRPITRADYRRHIDLYLARWKTKRLADISKQMIARQTTGTNLEFDQILQFAAILTDENLKELDCFEVRCRILPWVVPAPMALIVTQVQPSQLSDSSLPSHYEMMTEIQAKLESWSPATYVGFNSIRFDEPLLQRGLWQTLHSPYLTVTNNNSRLDLLPLIRAASHLFPIALKWPMRANGRIGFKLDELAPINGFDHSNAHDALADVEATIFLARLLRDKADPLWTLSASRSTKKGTAKLLKQGTRILVLEYFGANPFVWFGQRIDDKDASSSSAVLARLGFNWSTAITDGSEVLSSILDTSPKVLRELSLNKAPLVFSEAEAEEHFGLTPNEGEMDQSEFLNSNPKLVMAVLASLEDSKEPWSKSEVIEQRIFEGFPTTEDQSLMENFHRLEWPERVELIRRFQDDRLQQLAQRLIYSEDPNLLPREVATRIEKGISDRVSSERADRPWRTLEQAKAELHHCRESGICSRKMAREIEGFLAELEE